MTTLPRRAARIEPSSDVGRQGLGFKCTPDRELVQDCVQDFFIRAFDKPKDNAQVYLTHMARTLHPTQAELERTLPSLLAPAYDGLEVEF